MNTQRFCPLHSRFVKLRFPFDRPFRTKLAGRRVLFIGSANLPELNLTEMPFWHPRFCKPNPGPTESLNYKSLRSLSKNFRSVSPPLARQEHAAGCMDSTTGKIDSETICDASPQFATSGFRSRSHARDVAWVRTGKLVIAKNLPVRLPCR